MGKALILAALIAVIFTFTVYAVTAKNLGTHGPLFEISEPSVLDALMERLGEMEQNGEIAKLKTEMQDKTRSYVDRPKAAGFTTPTEEYRAFDVDLSIVVERDLADHKGQVFAHKGTVVNPLDHSFFDKRIILIDGDNEAEVEFALSSGNELDTLIVIVKGSPLDLTNTHGRRFYFDQDAVIAGRFQIEHTPSVVTRNYPTMLVEEIPVEETASERNAK